MSDVKRYTPEGYTQPASRSGMGTHMVESRDGDYVLASDYEDLSQRCRELEAANSRWLTENEDLLHSLMGSDARADAMRAELEQARRTAEHWKAEHLAGNAVIDTLRAEVETLRENREIASQCAANGGYLCSRDLIELRELLKK